MQCIRSLFLLVLALLVAVTAGFVSVRRTTHASLFANTVSLPIEVYPADGKSVHTESITVAISNPSGAVSLYLRLHQASYHAWGSKSTYDGAASFRINGGAWVALRNSTVQCTYPEELYNCLLGPWHTLRLEVPISGTGGLVSGDNTLEFRFNGTEGMRSGYRVLAVEVRNASDANLIDGTTFVFEDPETWTAPAGASASNGAALWNERDKLIDLDGNAFHAACSDCHATDGRDLQYFNYSNRVIEARGRAHGLSDQEARDIAAYIRSIDLQLPSYDCNGDGTAESRNTVCGAWPWNPPYQPGPQLDSKPVEWWAAGAGLNWVLDDDTDAIPYVFGSANPSQAQIDALMQPTATLNTREWPVAFMMPDWNNWLPDVWPGDGYGVSTLEASEAATTLQDLHNNLPGARQSWISSERSTYPEYGSLRDRLRKLTEIDYFRQQLGADPNGTYYLRLMSVQQWQTVKQWEVMTGYKLEDLGDDILTNNTNGYAPAGGRDRYWLAPGSSLYSIAPHINNKRNYPSVAAYRNQLENYYFSSAWYHLAVILQGGGRAESTGSPIDWNYHRAHINDVIVQTGHCNGMRYVQDAVVVLQTHTNWSGINPSHAKVAGLSMQHDTPAKFAEGYVYGAAVNCIPSGLRAKLAEGLLRAFMTSVEPHSPSAWPRQACCSTGDHVEPTTYVATVGDGSFTTDVPYADNFMRGLSRFEQMGVSAGLIDQAARWGDSMWDGNWSQFFCTSCGSNQAPSVSLTSPSNGATFTAPASVTLQAQASDADGTVAKVEFFSGTTKLGEDTSAPYSYAWTGVPVGSYTLTVRATDNDGATTTSAAITISVVSGNQAPTVSLTSPSDNATFTAPASVTLQAQASDADGTVAKVEFFSGTTKLGEDTSAPYSYAWTGVPVGSYTLTARATDNDGATTTSAAGTISVVSGDGSVVVAVNAGGNAFTAGDGTVYQADTGFSGGQTYSTTNAIAGTTDDVLYQTERYGNFSYSAAVPPGQYEVTLKFAEVYWTAAGVRIFDVLMEGQEVISNLDLYAAAGKDVAHDVLRVVTVNDGTLNIAFSTDADNAKVSAILVRSTGSTGGGATHDIGLVAGWNMISGTVTPGQPALEDVFADVLADIVIVKDELGQTFIPEYGINTIGDWDAGLGYMVYATQDVTLTLVGETIIPEDTPVALEAGWNMKAYLRTSPLSVDQAVASIASALVLVKNNTGDVYIPEYSINTIGDMQPGQGYKIYVTTATTLTYPANQGTGAGASTASKAGSKPGISASAVLVVEAPSLQEGDDIVVLTPERRVVGQGRVQQGRAVITVRGDAPLSEEEIEGARDGEALRLAVRAGASDQEKPLQVAMLRDGLRGRALTAGLHYTDDAFWVAQVEDVPHSFSLEQNYPNPFNPVTTIRYTLPEAAPVRLEVFNTLGQRVALLVDVAQPAGVYAVQFDATGVASGLYLYRMEAGAFVEQRRMVLMK